MNTHGSVGIVKGHEVAGPRKRRILVLGQLRPLNSGQAVMINHLADASFEDLELDVVPMNLADDVSQMGGFKLRKLTRVAQTVSRVILRRVIGGADVLYYCPGGSGRLAVLRDAAVLCATRWMFQRTVFHFHASGTGDAYQRARGPLRILMRAAFRKPDLTIRITKFNPPDGEQIGTRRDVVVPNGIPDLFDPARRTQRSGPLTILFMGLICRGKGVFDLLEAFANIRARGHDARLVLAGSIQSSDVEQEIREQLARRGLEQFVELPGTVAGERKLSLFYNADVFCMPSYFETFGLTALEAMQFEIPVVSCAVGGMQEIVEHEATGLLVAPGSIPDLTDALLRVLVDESTRRRMGIAGRARYLSQFTLNSYRSHMHDALVQA